MGPSGQTVKNPSVDVGITVTAAAIAFTAGSIAHVPIVPLTVPLGFLGLVVWIVRGVTGFNVPAASWRVSTSLQGVIGNRTSPDPLGVLADLTISGMLRIESTAKHPHRTGAVVFLIGYAAPRNSSGQFVH
jgi:hypothetical protein